MTLSDANAAAGDMKARHPLSRFDKLAGKQSRSVIIHVHARAHSTSVSSYSHVVWNKLFGTGHTVLTHGLLRTHMSCASVEARCQRKVVAVCAKLQAKAQAILF